MCEPILSMIQRERLTDTKENEMKLLRSLGGRGGEGILRMCHRKFPRYKQTLDRGSEPSRAQSEGRIPMKLQVSLFFLHK